MMKLEPQIVVSCLRMHFPDVQTADVTFAEPLPDERSMGLAAVDIRDEVDSEAQSLTQILGQVLDADQAGLLEGALSKLYLAESSDAGGVHLRAPDTLMLRGGFEESAVLREDGSLYLSRGAPAPRAKMEPTSVRVGNECVVILPRHNAVAFAKILPGEIEAPSLDALVGAAGSEDPWLRETYALLAGQGVTGLLRAVAMASRLGRASAGQDMLRFIQGSGPPPTNPARAWLNEQSSAYLRELADIATLRAEELADQFEEFGEDDEIPVDVMVAMACEREELEWSRDVLLMTETEHGLLDTYLDSIDNAGEAWADSSYTSAARNDALLQRVQREAATGWWALLRLDN